MSGSGYITGHVRGDISGGGGVGNPADLVTKTIGETHFYADSVAGNDANDGLTALTAKLTIQAALDALPDVITRNTCLHLSGSFDITSAVSQQITLIIAPRIQAPDTVLLITGEEALTVVADDGGSPWTADISSVNTVGLTTAGWTPNEYRGYWVEIIDGAAIGQTRTIHHHDATTIVPTLAWTVDPGACNFRIVRPSTEITSTNYNQIWVGVNSSGILTLQNIHISGGANLTAGNESGANAAGQTNNKTLELSAITIDAGSYPWPITIGPGSCYVGIRERNISTFGVSAAGSTAVASRQTGVSILTSGGDGLNLVNVKLACLNHYVDNSSSGLNIGGSSLTMHFGGCNIVGGIANSKPSIVAFESPPIQFGFLTTKAADCEPDLLSGSGLALSNYNIKIDGVFEVSDGSGFGMTLKNCVLNIEATISGNGNALGGCLVKNGSRVYLKSGVTPTLTGNSGTVEISVDGTTEATDWAAVQAGTVFSDVVGFNYIGKA